MDRTARSWLLRWLPPEAVRLARHWTGRTVRLAGSYASWQEAEAAAEGYDSAAILAQVRAATIAVRDGRAAFERDGTTFAEADPPLPLALGLMRAAALDRGRLHVLDFGGALGSTYFQCKPFLDGLSSVRWQVVEQPHFVACGRELFKEGPLGFSESISEAASAVSPNAAVLSGVLQYLPAPYAVLREIVGQRPRVIVIDRTPLASSDRDVVTLQRVSRRLVRSSYPAWVFNRDSLLGALREHYKIVTEFDSVDGVMGGMLRLIEFKGFVFEAIE